MLFMSGAPPIKRTRRSLTNEQMKLYIIIGALLLNAILSGCTSSPQAQQPAAAAYQPVYSTSTLTVYTNPDGAPIEVNGQPIGHSPVTFPIETQDGKLWKVYWITAVANGPGQLNPNKTHRLPHSIRYSGGCVWSYAR